MDFYTYTTHATLRKIADACPKAMTTYLDLLTRVDPDGKIKLTKYEVTTDLNQGFALFKNNVRQLARLEVIDYRIVNEQYNIEFCDVNE